jgi:hypothetical protein
VGAREKMSWSQTLLEGRTMGQKFLYACALSLALTLLPSGVAFGDNTLGTTTQPSGSSQNGCSTSNLTWAQLTTDPTSPSYVVPSPGQIISWSTNTAGDIAGTQVSLVALRPAGGGKYTVLAVDAETLPTPLPANNVATFAVARPILVQAGDRIGISGPATAICFWGRGSIPFSDTIEGYSTSPLSQPAPGQTITQMGGDSALRVNVSAVVSTQFDPAVSTGSAPAHPSVSNLALLSSTVTNHGPGSGPITFVDNIPSGMAINSASAGNGSCTISGQTVTCTVSGLPANASAPVNIAVTPSAAGSFTNHVRVSTPPGVTDPTPADDSATTTLIVAAKPAPGGCIVPKLRGTRPVRVAKRMLKVLGCKVKVKRKHGRGVPHGAVLKTKPKPGTYKLGRKVTLIVRG